jgi:quercetin dioxygenase-like cupin family protein
MALHHAASGEVVDLAPLGERLPQAHTAALVKTDSFEAVRLVLRAGETLPAHAVSGQFTLLCLEGGIVLDLADKSLSLCAHQWVYFDSGVTHAVRAIEPSSLLLTIQLPG